MYHGKTFSSDKNATHFPPVCITASMTFKQMYLNRKYKTLLGCKITMATKKTEVWKKPELMNESGVKVIRKSGSMLESKCGLWAQGESIIAVSMSLSFIHRKFSWLVFNYDIKIIKRLPFIAVCFLDSLYQSMNLTFKPLLTQSLTLYSKMNSKPSWPAGSLFANLFSTLKHSELTKAYFQF